MLSVCVEVRVPRALAEAATVAEVSREALEEAKPVGLTMPDGLTVSSSGVEVNNPLGLLLSVRLTLAPGVALPKA